MPLQDEYVEPERLTDFESEDVLEALRTDYEMQHYGGTGAHGAVTLDSLTARASDKVLPITGILRFLGGAWQMDPEGNSTHVAGLRPIQILATQNNYNPPGMSDAIMVEVDTDADRSITGLQRAARQKRLIIFGNRGNFNVTLEHNHSGSEYYNRFGMPNATDLILSSNEYVWLYYDVGSEIWRAISVL